MRIVKGRIYHFLMAGLLAFAGGCTHSESKEAVTEEPVAAEPAPEADTAKPAESEETKPAKKAEGKEAKKKKAKKKAKAKK